MLIRSSDGLDNCLERITQEWFWQYFAPMAHDIEKLHVTTRTPPEVPSGCCRNYQDQSATRYSIARRNVPRNGMHNINAQQLKSELRCVYHPRTWGHRSCCLWWNRARKPKALAREGICNTVAICSGLPLPGPWSEPSLSRVCRWRISLHSYQSSYSSTWYSQAKNQPKSTSISVNVIDKINDMFKYSEDNETMVSCYLVITFWYITYKLIRFELFGKPLLTCRRKAALVRSREVGKERKTKRGRAIKIKGKVGRGKVLMLLVCDRSCWVKRRSRSSSILSFSPCI